MLVLSRIHVVAELVRRQPQLGLKAQIRRAVLLLRRLLGHIRVCSVPDFP